MRQRIFPIGGTAIALLFGLSTTGLSDPLHMDENTWEFRGNVEAVKFKGKEALKLNNGRINLKDYTFKNGIIEFDISFAEMRGFMGVVFRIQDIVNAENFYFRPHQAGNVDANQYQPIFNGLGGWQLYFGAQYSTPVDYNFDEWMHVKVLVKDDRAEFYLDSDEPLLHVDDLLGDNGAGGISFSAGFAPAYFTNIEVTETEDVTFKGASVPYDPFPENLVTRFEVAEGAVLSSSVPPLKPLDPEAMAEKTWTTLDVERNGIANLARINGVEQMETLEQDEAGNAIMVTKATTLVRLKVHSDIAQTKVLKYGYSDKASVFANGQPVAGGDNTYMTRDYRYLGTVGLFDEVYLNLKEGENEIIFAVSEAFGGWAVMAQFPDMAGLEIRQ